MSSGIPNKHEPPDAAYRWIRSNVLGLVAIFIALSGSAIAAQVAERHGGKANAAAKKKKKGPRGPAGPQGPQGPTGPATGPAGGDLTGNYPNPLIAANAVGAAEVDGTLTAADIADDLNGQDDVDASTVDDVDMGFFDYETDATATETTVLALGTLRLEASCPAGNLVVEADTITTNAQVLSRSLTSLDTVTNSIQDDDFDAGDDVNIVPDNQFQNVGQLEFSRIGAGDFPVSVTWRSDELVQGFDCAFSGHALF